jgi:hypothetical protein
MPFLFDPMDACLRCSAGQDRGGHHSLRVNDLVHSASHFILSLLVEL